MRANLLAAVAAMLPITLICLVSIAHAASAADDETAQASVVGGQKATAGSFPWMAFVVDFEDKGAYTCTGTVLAPRVILTAAHCVLDEESGALRDASKYQVVTGVVDWTDPARQVSTVSRLIPYPKFAAGTTRDYFGDVAVLALTTPTSAPAIPIAKRPRFVRLGARARIAGWGMTSIDQTAPTESLMWARTVVEGERCEGFWGRVCVADFPKFASGVCFGDSGGPLLAHDRKRGWIEFGIAQGVFARCTTRRPQVFTRTDLLSKWIEGRVAKIEAG
jgi:secreted trypsin-like serine protease